MGIVGLCGVHGDVAAWAGGDMFGDDAQPSGRKQHGQKRDGDSAGAVSVAAECSPRAVHGPGQPSVDLTAFAEVLLLGDEDRVGIDVMTSGSAQCDKLLVGLRPVSIAVAGNQVQPWLQ